MHRLFLSVVTALMGLVVAGLGESPPLRDGPTPEAKTQDDPKPEAEAKDGESDPSGDLQKTYKLLRKLRSEAGSAQAGERPREWTERAAKLYRGGIEAYDRGDLHEAQAYSAAARELARAVEYARSAARSERPDPELPQPPRGRIEIKNLRHQEAEGAAELPPPLASDGDDDDQPTRPGRPPRPRRPAAAPVPRVQPTPAARPELTPSADEKVKVEVQVKKKREEILTRVKQLQGLQEQLRRTAEKHGDAQVADEKRALIVKLKELQRGVAEVQNEDDAARTRGDLKRAYDRIREARDKNPGSEAKFYIDAARDLYNAARSDAQAGRNDRARELARAAEALTLVPKHLGHLPADATKRREIQRFEYRVVRPDSKKEKEKEKETKAGAKESSKDEEVIVKKRKRVEEKQGKEDGSPKPEGESPKDDGDTPKRRIERRIEIRRSQDGKSSKKEEGDASDRGEAKPTPAGIGAALGMDDGVPVVEQIVPGGPADKDGRLKPRDKIVGVVTKDGEVVDLAEKDLGDIAGLIRGESGTQVRIVVVPDGQDDRKTYELTRKTIVPPAAAGPAEEGKKSDARDGAPKPADRGDELPPPLPE